MRVSVVFSPWMDMEFCIWFKLAKHVNYVLHYKTVIEHRSRWRLLPYMSISFSKVYIYKIIFFIIMLNFSSFHYYINWYKSLYYYIVIDKSFPFLSKIWLLWVIFNSQMIVLLHLVVHCNSWKVTCIVMPMQCHVINLKMLWDFSCWRFF